MIGVIGIGSMGGAIVKGLINSGTPASSILISSASVQSRADFANETGTIPVESNTELVRRAGEGGIIVVAVKPYAVSAVLEEIREEAAGLHSVILSVAAGISISHLESHLEKEQAVARTMPNVAAAVRESMTALAINDAARPYLSQITSVLESIGTVAEIKEEDFATFTAIAGCSPAFTFNYIDAMARAAVYNGLPKQEATSIATQAVYGAAKLLLEQLHEGVTAASLADSIQSPGGTTVAGVVELEQAGFGAAVVRGVQASIDRDAELG